MTNHLDSEEVHTGPSEQALQRDYIDNLLYHQGRYPAIATPHDRFMAFAFSVRDRMLYQALNLIDTLVHTKAKTVCYFSAEYLFGPKLGNNLLNLGIYESAKKALQASGVDLEELLTQETEPGLGGMEAWEDWRPAISIPCPRYRFLP